MMKNMPKKTISEKLNATIRRELKRQKLSQAELARRAGISPGQLSRLLRGHYEPTLKNAEAILAALGGKFLIDIPKRPLH